MSDIRMSECPPLCVSRFYIVALDKSITVYQSNFDNPHKYYVAHSHSRGEWREPQEDPNLLFAPGTRTATEVYVHRADTMNAKTTADTAEQHQQRRCTVSSALHSSTSHTKGEAAVGLVTNTALADRSKATTNLPCAGHHCCCCWQ